MSISLALLIIVIIGFIFSGVIVLKQSAKKFNLTDEQLKNIKEREKKLSAEDKEDER